MNTPLLTKLQELKFFLQLGGRRPHNNLKNTKSNILSLLLSNIPNSYTSSSHSTTFARVYSHTFFQVMKPNNELKEAKSLTPDLSQHHSFMYHPVVMFLYCKDDVVVKRAACGEKSILLTITEQRVTMVQRLTPLVGHKMC